MHPKPSFLKIVASAETHLLFKVVPLFFAASLAVSGASAQITPALPTLSADQIVERLIEKNKERAQALQHYIGKRSYRLEYRGFPASADATMEVEVNFDAPGSKHFTVLTQTGPKMIQNRVFQRLLDSEAQAGDATNRQHTELGPDNYNFMLDRVDGANYVLTVEPKVESKYLYKGQIWVDGHDFAVTRIEAQPARNPSFWTTKSLIHHTYQRVDNGLYLPKENRTVTSVRLGGVATLTIEYESYQVTAGRIVAAAGKPFKSVSANVWPDGGATEEVSQFMSGRK